MSSLIEDPGLAVVEHIFKEMKIDGEWSTRQERGFTWWGKDFAQTVWAEPLFEDSGFRISRVHARTDVAAGFKGTPENLAKLSALNRFASLSALIVDGRESSEIRFAASMYVHEQTLPWVKRLFSIAVATQAVDAQIKGKVIAGMLGARPAVSGHPESGRRNDCDDMLNFLAAVVAPRGQRASLWQGEEVKEAVEQLQGPPCILATGDDRGAGLTAEFPFFERTSLLRATTEEAHPQLGTGILFRLSLPITDSKQDWPKGAHLLNTRELDSFTRAPFLGSWCAGDQAITFVIFYPNIAYQPGLLWNLITSMVIRARWVAEEASGDNWNESFERASRAKMEMMEALGEVFTKKGNKKTKGTPRRAR